MPTKVKQQLRKELRIELSERQNRPKTASKPKSKISRRPVTKQEVAFVCSITDPFCEHAIASKYSDLANTKSLPFAYHGRLVLTCDAGGYAAAAMLPVYNYLPWCYATSFTGSTATFSLTNPLIANTLPVAGACRMVSMGVKLRSIVAPLNASGMVRIRGFASQDTSGLNSVDINTYNCDFYEDIPLNACKETCVILKRLDPTAKNFVDPADITPTNNPNTVNVPGFGFVLIAVGGGPPGFTVLDIEVFCHWEVTLSDNNQLSQLMTSPPPYNPHLSNAVDAVSSTSKNVFLAGAEMVGKYIEKHAIEYLAEALMSA